MKGFRFTLDPLLRLKEVEKTRIEVELAEHQKEVAKYTDQLKSEHDSISAMLMDAELKIKNQHSISCLLNIPNSVGQKKSNIFLLEKKITDLQNKSKEILHRLSTKVSELKKVNELKDEQMQEYKKKLDKQEQQNSEEMFNLQKESKKNRMLYE